MKTMKYEEIELIKQSEKGTVHLVRKKDSEQVFVRKILKGQYPIYEILKDLQHPCLPKLYEVSLSDDATTVIEEYIEGQSPDGTELTAKQLSDVVRELCSVLDFLHGKGIIHRDIKPSNLILGKDGHIHLIDFDAARMPKDDLEQDTRLLGTRGYAPPEQYGFAQTDERTDIYSLGITLKQLLGGGKLHYKRVIAKCTDLDPAKRYQSVRQVKDAFFRTKQKICYVCAAVLAVIVLGTLIFTQFITRDIIAESDIQSDGTELTVLPAPENPHWNGESGLALWKNVRESGYEDDVEYYWRLYKKESNIPPEPDDPDWYCEGDMGSNRMIDDEYFEMNFGKYFEENGFYFFAVASKGDEVSYTSSPFVVSDAFAYTGESAPMLPAPEGLEWKMYESAEGEGRIIYATWDNLDDYADTDSFDVCVYDKDGNYVMNNTWPKAYIVERGMNGIQIRKEFLSGKDNAYRFTVRALTSRPNEFRSSPMPDPPTEEYFSPWY